MLPLLVSDVEGHVQGVADHLARRIAPADLASMGLASKGSCGQHGQPGGQRSKCRVPRVCPATPLYGPLFPGFPLPIAVQLPAAAPLAPPDPMALLKQQQLQVVLPAMAAVAKDAPSYVYAMRMMQPWFVLPNPSLVDAKAVVRLLNPDITEANCDVKGRELLVERSRQIRQIQSIIACMQQRAAMLPAFTPSHP